MKCWLCKPENLSSAPSAQLKNKQSRDRRISGVWPASLVKSISSSFKDLSKIYWFGSYHSLELVGLCGKMKTSKLALLLQTDYCPAPLLVLTTLTELTLCICVVFLWTLYSILWVNLSILELKTILLITPALQEVLLIYKGTHACFKNSLSHSKGTEIGQNFD